MVHLYLCKACEEGRHGECDIGTSCPPGHYGGSKCMCGCGGDATWNTPERIDRELRELVQKIMDHQQATERMIPLEVNCPPKKIELKQVDKEG